MANLSKIYLYRMTHIENVPHLLAHGITHRDSAQANPNYIPIGDASLITTRNSFLLENGRQLGDYIPFYFGARMPMLYVIQNGFNGVPSLNAEQIVYCVSSVAKVLEAAVDFVFTDGHAVDTFSTQYTKADIGRLAELLDFKAIKARYWKDDTDLDLKRRKEAEFLVSGDLPVSAILGFIVFNENAKNRLLAVGLPDKQIHINSNAYF
ncbi:MAG: DUF4433 domain-containing protein [Lewinellaceae bacterium]|nr:DUF4433 domain-containing protein [Lewinellaceae bacterium]